MQNNIEVYQVDNLDISGAQNDNQLIAAWLKLKKETTRITYQTGVVQFFDFVDVPIEEITAAILADYVEYLQSIYSSDNTVANKLNCVKSLLTFASETGYIRFNVGTVVRPPKRPLTIAQKILTETDVQKILNSPDNDMSRAVLHTLYYTGIRVGELCALNTGDVVVDSTGAVRLVISKSKSNPRTILLPAKLGEMILAVAGLAENPNHDPIDENSKTENPNRDPIDENPKPIFPNRDPIHENPKPTFLNRDPLFKKQTRPETGQRLTPNSVYKLVEYHAGKAGIRQKVSPHWFRHAHITHAINNGASIHLVQRNAGHSSLATTGVYTHITEDDSSGLYLK